MTSAKDLEQAERAKAGLPADYSVDQDDIGFRFVRPSTPDQGATAYLAGDYAGMEAAWQNFDDIRGSSTFQPIEPQPLDELPPVETVFETPPGFLAWIACDGHYFEKLGAKSLASHQGPAHVHLMDADPAYAKEVISYLNRPIGLTVEHPGADPRYYHSVRFCRFAQMMQTRTDPMVMLDADSLANRPITNLPRAPIAMRLSPGRVEPWNQCIATVVVGTPEALPYFSGVADYIFHYWRHNKLQWHIDQMALFSVWKRLGVPIRALNNTEVDYDFQDNGIVWCNSGPEKWQPGETTRFSAKMDQIEIPSP
jgi:hypothetical protein